MHVSGESRDTRMNYKESLCPFALADDPDVMLEDLYLFSFFFFSRVRLRL